MGSDLNNTGQRLWFDKIKLSVWVIQLNVTKINHANLRKKVPETKCKSYYTQIISLTEPNPQCF